LLNLCDDCEVIVVDNLPDYSTRFVVENIQEKGFKLRYLIEKRMGLSSARNKGWKVAKGQYVAFVDDDAVVSKNWSDEILSYINRNPEVEVFGGPYSKFFLSAPPSWFPPDYGESSWGKKEKELLIPKEWLSGTNIIIKKNLLKKLGGFNTNLGMKGKKVAYGEETLLQMEVNKLGIPIYYLPSIRVEHLVSEYKYSLSWLLKSSYQSGRSFYMTHGIKPGFVKVGGELLISILVGIKKLFTLPSMPIKRRVYYGLGDVFFNFGAFINYIFN